MLAPSPASPPWSTRPWQPRPRARLRAPSPYAALPPAPSSPSRFSVGRCSALPIHGVAATSARSLLRAARQALPLPCERLCSLHPARMAAPAPSSRPRAQPMSPARVPARSSRPARPSARRVLL
uniref:Uncharacterized protein n=1 Tax=Zea mays TaxID=4577 RepID=C0PCR7_MAIZE|nr:unknown [Zea mays]|eukprot:NP_001169211.1 uncharacterized protein LOC100383067 [Zea mays]